MTICVIYSLKLFLLVLRFEWQLAIFSNYKDNKILIIQNSTFFFNQEILWMMKIYVAISVLKKYNPKRIIECAHSKILKKILKGSIECMHSLRTCIQKKKGKRKKFRMRVRNECMHSKIFECMHSIFFSRTRIRNFFECMHSIFFSNACIQFFSNACIQYFFFIS